mgnify:CR=1 FL=1
MISDEGVVVSGKVGQKKSRIAYPGVNDPDPDPTLEKKRSESDPRKENI